METRTETERRSLFEQLRAEIRGELQKPARNLLSHDWERVKLKELGWAKARVQKRPIAFRRLEAHLRLRSDFRAAAARLRILSLKQKWQEAGEQVQPEAAARTASRGGAIGGYRAMQANWQRDGSVERFVSRDRDRERD